VVSALVLSGCARIEVYEDENLQGPEKGVRFYYSKPYLLVAQTATTSDGKPSPDSKPMSDDKADNSAKVSVIYLPDQSKPMYAKLKTGYGSADLSLAFKDGILTNIGQKTDTKIPETITALSGMVKEGAAVAQARVDYSSDLNDIADGLDNLFNDAKKKKLLNNEDVQMGKSTVNAIKEASSRVKAAKKSDIPLAISLLKSAIANLDKIKEGHTDILDRIKAFRDRIQDIVNKLTSAKITTKQLPTFELYEINTKNDGKSVINKVYP
jgi:hypothetical protein